MSNYTTSTEQYHTTQFLTFSTQKKIPLFNDLRLCQLFVDNLDEQRKKLRFLLYAFVVMPDHVHLLIWSPETILSRVLQGIKGSFSRKALEVIRQNDSTLYELLRIRSGRQANHRFWLEHAGTCKPVPTLEKFLKGVEYIHENPVKNGFVENPIFYKWSSAKFWLKGTPQPLKMDVPDWM
ncbi:transposase [bacterium]|nr:transposase [bacterium]